MPVLHLQSYPHRVDGWDSWWVLVGGWVGFCMVGCLFYAVFLHWSGHTMAISQNNQHSRFTSFYILTRQGTDCLISCASFEGSSSSSSYACLRIPKQFLILYDIIYYTVYNLVWSNLCTDVQKVKTQNGSNAKFTTRNCVWSLPKRMYENRMRISCCCFFIYVLQFCFNLFFLF